MVSTEGRKKFDFRIIVFVAIGVFIVAIAVFGSSYSQQTAKLAEANKKVTSTQARVNTVNLAPFNSRKVELDQQVSKAAVDLKAVGANLSPSINRTTVIGVLFTAATKYRLEVTRMTFEGPGEALLGTMPVSSALLTATVEGDMPQLAAFITEMNTFANGAFDSATMTSITGNETGNVTGNATGIGRSWADINLTLYTVRGR